MQNVIPSRSNGNKINILKKPRISCNETNETCTNENYKFVSEVSNLLVKCKGSLIILLSLILGTYGRKISVFITASNKQ